MQNRTYKSNSGFTLAEVAIAIVIIGLLIGGILKGVEIINTSRVSATITKVNEIQAAMYLFAEKYDKTLPGDFSKAMTRLPNCNSGTFCVNGNGDDRMGAIVAGATALEPWYNVPSGINTENTQFWKHLALAGLINEVDPAASTIGWGVSHPQSPLHGGFFVRYSVALIGSMSGTTMTLRNDQDGVWRCTVGVECSATPNQASLIDRKMDDGNASTGNVQAISENWSSGCGVPNTGNQDSLGYDESEASATCDMMFKLKRTP